ncbi:MAG: hypothetical protein K2H64_00350 [Desulfovibrio sp.]|nr:hypothetical protein [Desulfovibrio sp.]
MLVSYQDNKEAGAGHGYLVFSQAAFPDGPWQAAVQTPSSQEYLTGRRGAWAGDEIFLPLEGEVAPDGSIRLKIGPEIVDSLGMTEKYRVKLKGADGGKPLTGRLAVTDITYSPVMALDNTAKAAETLSREPETPPGRPAPKPAPEIISREPERPAPPEPSPSTEERKEEERPSPPPGATEGTEDDDSSGKKKILVAVIVALFLIGAGIGGYFLYKKLSGDVAPPVAETPPPAPEAPPAPERPQASVTDQVNAFFAKGDGAPKQAMELAQTLSPASPAEQDALYRLYNFAGEKGEPSSLIVYGACFDPSKPQWGSIGKDGFIAWEIYDKAKQANVAGADEAITNLQKWLENAAREGDTGAAGTLRKIGQQTR